MEHLGDRRVRRRFEVVGSLAGALDVVDRGRVVNISRLGVLTTCAVAPPIGSTVIVRLILAGEEISVDARVRHIRLVAQDQEPHYLVGLEFLSSSRLLETAIDRVAVEAEFDPLA